MIVKFKELYLRGKMLLAKEILIGSFLGGKILTVAFSCCWLKVLWVCFFFNF